MLAKKHGCAVVDEAWLTRQLEHASVRKADLAPAPPGATTVVASASLDDGDTAKVMGSSGAEYTIKNTGGVMSCTCPAWRNQSRALNQRSCKHLKEYLGEAFEIARTGTSDPPSRASAKATGAKAKSTPKLLLADKYVAEKHNIDGWWMSEKLDGVRAFWDGQDLLSRAGNRFDAPEWFTKALPTVEDGLTLDGELFTGRGDFNTTISIVRSSQDARWGVCKSFRTLPLICHCCPGCRVPPL
jgi:DNA ligase-1